MKFIWIMLLLAGCSQKALVGPSLPAISNSAIDKNMTFLNDCSQIRPINQTLWLLTCQKPPHADRTEIYEWSQESEILKRLTFQDGQIWDIAPIDKDYFYYSSSYDEFKEQFVSILSGAKPGSDIYLKNRNRTTFDRLTQDKGLEISFFWSNNKNLLYYVYETETTSRIMTLNSKKKQNTIYSVAKKSIRNPIYLDENKTLYWIEYDLVEKGTVIKAQANSKKPVTLYKSDSKIFGLSSSLKSSQLLVGFATGVGIEIWNLNLADSCWRLAYRIAEPVSEFFVLNDKTLFLTIKNRLKQDFFLPASEVCHPSPPGLGVSPI